MTPSRYFIFDFDSTLIQVESLPEPARASLRHHLERSERLAEVERIIELTGTGRTSMSDGIELLNGRRKHIDSVVRILKRAIKTTTPHDPLSRPGPSNYYAVCGVFRDARDHQNLTMEQNTDSKQLIRVRHGPPPGTLLASSVGIPRPGHLG